MDWQTLTTDISVQVEGEDAAGRTTLRVLVPADSEGSDDDVVQALEASFGRDGRWRRVGDWGYADVAGAELISHWRCEATP